MTNHAHPPTQWKRPAIFGFALIAITFAGLGGWSSFAKLSSAAVASGAVNVESSRKTVQHLEGGIIRKILVREGQRVKKGQILFQLDDTQASAVAGRLRSQLDSVLAYSARLSAEQRGEKKVRFSGILLNRKHIKNAAEVMSDQSRVFNRRSASRAGQRGLLEARIKQLRTEIGGLQVERKSTQAQLQTIKEELRDLKRLFSKKLVRKSRYLALQRDRSRLSGVIGGSTVNMAKARNAINETRLQIRQLEQKFQEEVTGQLAETRTKIADLGEKLRVALDVFKRLNIHSPRAGVIQNLKISTKGAVIRSGQPLLDVTPENEKLIVRANISPLDIDSLRVGLKAEIRLPSFNARNMPIIFGKVRTISRDSLVDESTKQPYFLAQIDVDEKSLPKKMRKRLVAGMPAEIVIPTGSRTVLQYMMQPLVDRLRVSLREE